VARLCCITDPPSRFTRAVSQPARPALADAGLDAGSGPGSATASSRLNPPRLKTAARRRAARSGSVDRRRQESALSQHPVRRRHEDVVLLGSYSRARRREARAGGPSPGQASSHLRRRTVNQHVASSSPARGAILSRTCNSLAHGFRLKVWADGRSLRAVFRRRRYRPVMRRAFRRVDRPRCTDARGAKSARSAGGQCGERGDWRLGFGNGFLDADAMRWKSLLSESVFPPTCVPQTLQA
jgi:hypothetical protein